MARRTKWTDRWNYKFDNFMSRGGFSVFAALLFLFAASFVVMALIRYVVFLIVPDETIGPLSDQLWRVFLQISDAGAVAEDTDASMLNKTIGIITIFLGLVLFSSLVAFITSQFENKLDELRKGRSLVVEKNHSLLLGFNERVLEIVRELVIANESERDAAVVVLADAPKDEMDDFFREHVTEPKSTRIITRSGSTSSQTVLRKVGIESAKSVVVLSEASADAEEVDLALADAKVLKTIMAVLASTGEDNCPPIIAEIHRPTIRDLAQSLSPAVTVIEEHALLAKLMVQTSRVAGLAAVYDDLVGFDGCEFYFHRPKQGWGGASFSEVQFRFHGCCALGYRGADGSVVINPQPDTIIPDDAEILVLAEDDSEIRLFAEPVAGKAPSGPGTASAAAGTERHLVVGWNRKAPTILGEYADYLGDGSAVDVVIPDSLDEPPAAKEVMDRISKDNPGLTIQLLKVDVHNQDTLTQMRLEDYDNVVILKADGGDSEARDSETIAVLLRFRQYLKETVGADPRTRLISEIADSENVEVIQKAGVKDFLISNKFVSKIYAQASEDPQVMGAYGELFKAEGSEIYLKPVSTYYAVVPSGLKFADLCAAALVRNETCFGYRRNSSIRLNPPKAEGVEVTAEDYLIVLAEDES